MTQPRILVVTSCTGEKKFKPENQLGFKDFENRKRLASGEKKLVQSMCTAGEMYTGMQHLRLMEGVKLLRNSFEDKAIDVNILSAGYGLIPENRMIAPYEVTFNGMKGHEVDSWASQLGIQSDFEKAIQGYDLVFLLLGENYLRSLSLAVNTRTDQTFIFLASQSSRKWIRSLNAKTFILPLSNSDAKHYRYGLVGLKGFLFKKFAEIVVTDLNWRTKVYNNPQYFKEILDYVVEPIIESEQLELSLGVARANRKIKQAKAKLEPDYLLIPDNLPPAPNIHLGMQYFIPEWDDRVDPNYDFLTDTITPNRDPYKDEVYAHELFSPEPNYDAILVSKVVIENSRRKRLQIEEIGGIHKFIRWQGKVMGDCGAFGYIKEDVPPFNTIEILDYYQKFGFDLGVSIDHLIVGPFAQEGLREMRYELTLKNAQEFIEKHQQGGYSFTPIGAAQGWNPETYANAVKELIIMGYDYIALGGLARAQTREIVEILKSIRPHLQSNIRMHLFGVARLDAIPIFRHLGLTSFDSASALRRAWLDSSANYHAQSGQMYAAVRIPSVDGQSVRIKNIVEAGICDRDTLRKLEQNALHAMRAFDKNELGIEETLSVLLEYDDFLELPRDGKVDPVAKLRRSNRHETMYLKLLTDRPWQQCNCKICSKTGVETVIFRGNDRNRRRGFHNTYIFYKKFKELLKELEISN